MKRLLRTILLAGAWVFIGVHSLVLAEWWAGALALLLALVAVDRFFTAELIAIQRKLIEHERERGDMFEMSFEEKREICAEWRAEALRLGSELEKF